jgi:hypothetical protein
MAVAAVAPAPAADTSELLNFIFLLRVGMTVVRMGSGRSA